MMLEKNAFKPQGEKKGEILQNAYGSVKCTVFVTSLVKWNIVSLNVVKMIPHIKTKNSILFFLKEKKFCYVTNDHIQ